MKRIVLRIGIALALIAAITAALALRQHGSDPAPTAAGPSLHITGTYADDWQENCGPLTGAAQVSCNDRLNAKYGRVEDTPVPKADK
ncbi:hypothetical protein [Magnetospirillum molischianum]|uniref:Uncharacterized protein n=1 Tax=Magnetospirillum molischianum DSM 120 TaxID=1150626 RepID=H8FTS5_MAGML|nr:hypothetical protein [Magnetospirillum molischianum]CCG41782.1 exported hypothetical protein [Magnetospirillum molischianum DSM 120]